MILARRCTNFSTTCSRPCGGPRCGNLAALLDIIKHIAVIEYPEDGEILRTPGVCGSSTGNHQKKGSDIGQEGCLSIPGLAADVERATAGRRQGPGSQRQEIRIKAYDWLARIFQHEIDHLRRADDR